jgi:hypothetical protein
MLTRNPLILVQNFTELNEIIDDIAMNAFPHRNTGENRSKPLKYSLEKVQKALQDKSCLKWTFLTQPIPKMFWDTDSTDHSHDVKKNSKMFQLHLQFIMNEARSQSLLCNKFLRKPPKLIEREGWNWEKPSRNMQVFTAKQGVAKAWFEKGPNDLAHFAYHVYSNYQILMLRTDEMKLQCMNPLDFYIFKEEIIRTLAGQARSIKIEAAEEISEMFLYLLTRLNVWTGDRYIYEEGKDTLESKIPFYLQSYTQFPNTLNTHYPFLPALRESMLEICTNEGICTKPECEKETINLILESLLEAFKNNKSFVKYIATCNHCSKYQKFYEEKEEESKIISQQQHIIIHLSSPTQSNMSSSNDDDSVAQTSFQTVSSVDDSTTNESVRLEYDSKKDNEEETSKNKTAKAERMARKKAKTTNEIVLNQIDSTALCISKPNPNSLNKKRPASDSTENLEANVEEDDVKESDKIIVSQMTNNFATKCFIAGDVGAGGKPKRGANKQSQQTVLAQTWIDVVAQKHATSFERIRQEFGNAVDAKMNCLELPIPIEMRARHVDYGDVILIAILWWIDPWDSDFVQPPQIGVHQTEYFLPNVSEDGVKTLDVRREPRRICFFHSIQEIVGIGKFTPAAGLIGRMFSSLHFSANLIGKGRENGFDQWRILGTNIRLSSFIRLKENIGSWRNYPDMVKIDAGFNGLSVPSVMVRDALAVLCRDECNKFTCGNVQLCKHGKIHSYDLKDADIELIKNNKSMTPADREKKQEKLRVEERKQRVSSPWGRAIWFEDASPKDVLYNFTWPGYIQTVIDREVRRTFKRFFPRMSLQLSFSYVFPETFLGEKDTNVATQVKSALHLLRYFRFFAKDSVVGRIMKETDIVNGKKSTTTTSVNWNDSEVIEDQKNPLFMTTWKLNRFAWRLFEPMHLNNYTIEESYGTYLRIPMRWNVLKAFSTSKVSYPLRGNFSILASDPNRSLGIRNHNIELIEEVKSEEDKTQDTEEKMSVCDQFLLEQQLLKKERAAKAAIALGNGNNNNNAEEEKKEVEQLLVSDEDLKRIHNIYVKNGQATLMALETKIASCALRLDAKRIQYFENTQFFNPGRVEEIDERVNDHLAQLDEAESDYIKHCLAAACFKRAHEVVEKGLMLLERQKVYWYNDVQQTVFPHHRDNNRDPYFTSEEFQIFLEEKRKNQTKRKSRKPTKLEIFNSSL